MMLSSENFRQCYIPPGFAHGFLVTSESALFAYKCTAAYQPRDEGTIRWNDPELAIDWPIASPVLSPKDEAAPALKEIPADRLPRHA
jgi:dTDP-4-dehydrorhamnose 3,5-epimerase